MQWNKAYEAYPINDNMIWLNNCGAVPAGRHVLGAVTRFMEGYCQKGFLTETAIYKGVRDRIKTILARLLGCDADELALIHNTAEGLNQISHGLNLQPGDEIVLLENEFPSNWYPWQHWQQKGVRLITTPMTFTPQDFMADLSQRITDRTRIVSLSAVHWCTGMPLPLNQIGELCAQHDIDFVLDGAQGVGVQEIDLKAAKVAYMAFPAWKWLMGPLGLGVLYVAKERLEMLKPTFIGPLSMASEKELPYSESYKPTADRFTYSTANFGDWVYFQAALEFLERFGFETVRRRIFKLSDHLQSGLKQIGFEVLANRFPDHPTATVVCEKPGVAAAKIVADLEKHHIIVRERQGRVRMAPHIYIAPEQINETVDRLSR